jgi:hypothetical protein
MLMIPVIIPFQGLIAILTMYQCPNHSCLELQMNNYGITIVS